MSDWVEKGKNVDWTKADPNEGYKYALRLYENNNAPDAYVVMNEIMKRPDAKSWPAPMANEFASFWRLVQQKVGMF